MVTDNNQNNGTNGSMKYNGKIDIVKLFQMQTLTADRYKL